MNIYICFILSFIFLDLALAGKRKTGETKYKAQYQSTVGSCDDFENKVIDASDMVLNDQENSLHGKLVVGSEMSEGVMLELTIYKVNDQGDSELVASFQTGLCEALKETDAPWSPIFEQIGFTECPISEQEIDVPKLLVDTSFADDFMSHDYVGDYFVVFALSKIADDAKDGTVDLVCYNILIKLIEYKEEEEEEE